MNKEGVLYWTNGWNWHSLDNPNRFPMSDIDMYMSCIASVTNSLTENCIIHIP